jgi:membrane protease YdiL (CAAX protease family)
MSTEIILTYGFLLLGVIAIWIKHKRFKKLPLWLLFTAVAFVFAICYNRASFISLIYSSVFGFSVYAYYQKKSVFLFIMLLILAAPLLLHLPFVAFNNYRFLDHITLTENASPYSLYFNFDKTLVGVFIIALGYNSTKLNVKRLLKLLIINLIVMSILFLGLATLLGYSKFEPKLPTFTFVWILVNLFSTCLAEEAIFRKLIQQHLYESIPGKYAAIISIAIASLLFGIAHYNGGILYIILATIAGLFYGYIYYKTKRIESSMLLHVSFNLIHLLLFTYPSIS